MPHNGLVVFGLGSLVEVEPTRGRTYSVHDLPRSRVFEIERAFDLPGSVYDRRKSSQVCTIRREMAEIGIPISLIGCSVDAMHNQLKRCGSIRDGTLTFDLTPHAFAFEGRGHWRARRPYEPKRTVEERLRQAGYTAFRVLASANIAGELIQLSPTHYRIPLKGRSAAWALFSEYERQVERRDRFLVGPALRSRKLNDIRYVFSRVRRIRRRSYSGALYRFDLADESAGFVAAGVPVASLSWAKHHGEGSPEHEFAASLLRCLEKDGIGYAIDQ